MTRSTERMRPGCRRRELVRRTHEAAGLPTTLVLLAAPAAREYYPHIGMVKHESCWIVPRRPKGGEG